MTETLERIVDPQVAEALDAEKLSVHDERDPFSFNDLPDELKVSYGSQENFDRAISEFVNAQIDDINSREAFDESQHPQFPETPQYKAEIENPHFVVDPETGISYATYILNQDKIARAEDGTLATPPLVMELQWAAGAETRAGRRTLRALTEVVDQPIIVMDMIGTGKTSIPDHEWLKQADFDQMAESKKRALDQELASLNATDFDMAGVSLGGIMASKLTALYGEKVRNLVTVATPGVAERSLLSIAKGFAMTEAKANADLREANPHSLATETAYYEDIYGPIGGNKLERKKLPAELKWQLAVPVLALAMRDQASEHISTEKLPSLLKFYKLMTKNVLKDVPQRFSPNTNWADIAGSNDTLSDSADHLALVRARNDALEQQGLPKRSTATILGSQPHAWTERSTMLSNTISQALYLGRGRRERMDAAPTQPVGVESFTGENRREFKPWIQKTLKTPTK